MMDNIQIVLFFENQVVFNQNKIASDINEKLSYLGNAIVLPVNHEDPTAPIVLFTENKDINITINAFNVAIIFSEKDLKKYKDCPTEIINIFDKESIAFSRIGLIITRYLEKTNAKKLKARIFKEEEIIDSEDFNVGWFNAISIDGTKVNCWERYFLDENKKIISIFDINTPHNEKYFVNDEFVENYISQCIKYIDNKIKK